ncbi:hypothetical protein PHYSODRAFT_532776 [Phytophthora sojae]|uniref:FHA domain-containing protein n=1 Tax=Phytophthora sojae (strain P6497) TaxID=1094619 RepID=G5AEQ4_PHYSP|nr:hypothetical protein PHYSODRAFT_532776 [Phytophthora sojae]EGZ05694.1 hypothetical protein PHYSODRAFT_532776 [Phytophthora sojae]|eukprot:XP_009538555.1 hypothetical protein PHYSODRAFT_532776 [Phytophthora sojae]
MPFLRSLDVVDSSLELRSSKTLIGSAAATCDVVVTGDNVLDLHALLNLASDKASAKLVPFSTSEAGVCYVNDVVVPREGATVVHGDRVAFGHPRNVFLFELTPHPQMTAMSTAQSIETEYSHDASANRAFRRALDTLRGDRKATTPNASVMASIQTNQRNRRSVSSVESSAPSPSKSKDQLSKFLLEASTDSLLSDYVERKLKQRRSGSTALSRQSSVAGSQQRDSRRGDSASSSVRQSRETRNLVEVEKLKLSQRIREVNDVLNGDMDFQDSYLSPTAKSNEDEDDDEEEDDDLPAMMEKPASPPANHRLASLSASIQTEHSEQVSEVSGPQQQRQSSNPPKARDFFAKAMSLGLNDLTRSDSRPVKVERQDAAKTALHEKLINQTIRLKRNEIKSQTFVRWQRGLRIQSQNRERKARKLQEVSAALGKLRRGHIFHLWRDVATLSSQVIICRLEAFQQRCESRLVRKCWTALYQHHLSMAQRSKLLRGLVVKKALLTRHVAFRRWERVARLHTTQNRLLELQRREQHILDVHLERISERHYHHRSVQPLLVQILRRWRAIADQHKKQQQKLRRVFLRRASKLVLRSWRKWSEVTHLEQYHVKLKMQAEQYIQQTTERLTSQHEQVQSSRREDHATQLQKLMEVIEEKDQELEKLKRQQRAEVLEKVCYCNRMFLPCRSITWTGLTRALTCIKAAAKTQWEKDLHSFFEIAIVKVKRAFVLPTEPSAKYSCQQCDEQIAQASDQLEGLLQSAEDDVLVARFGAAQVGSLLSSQNSTIISCSRHCNCHR